jgi:hypothetical protein
MMSTPRSASVRAVSRPIRFAPPVTRAVLPFNSSDINYDYANVMPYALGFLRRLYLVVV